MATNTTELRRARRGDVAAIAALARDEIENGLHWSWRPLRVAQTLARKDTLAVVATEADELLGFCIASYGYERMHVQLLGVAPWARGLGIGRRLMEWHTECALNAGLVAVSLEVRASNEGAIAFYQRLGFAPSTRLRRYYQGREDAVRMIRTLDPRRES